MEENIIIMPMFAALMITLIVVFVSAFIKKDTEPVKQEWNITAWNKWYSDYRADSEDHSINTFNFVVNKRWGDKYRAYIFDINVVFSTFG